MELTKEEHKKRANMVVTDSDGILPFFEAFYIESLRYSANRAKDAFRRFDDIRFSRAHSEIVGVAQEAVTHVAGLSRFFWVAGKAANDPLHQARAQKLRQSFELDDSCPLNDRYLRNAIEHFDEKLDNFLLGDLAGYIFPDPIVGPIESIGEVDKMFRFIDPDKDIFILLGTAYGFRPLREAVEDILTKISKMNGGRLTVI
jgi:hypothetical protein